MGANRNSSETYYAVRNPGQEIPQATTTIRTNPEPPEDGLPHPQPAF